MLGQAFRHELYNHALPVGVADGVLNNTKRFPDFLAAAAALVTRHELNDIAGVFLIHRHNVLAADSVMIETDTVYNSAEALITRARPVQESLRAVPTRWVFCGGRFEPFEYSDDLRLSVHLDALGQNEDFVRELGCLLEQYEVTDVLGLCLFEREFYSKGPHGHQLVEETDDQMSANIVQWVRDDLDEERLIKTVWCFPTTEAEEGLTCTPNCVTRCRFSAPDDSHYGTHLVRHTNIG